MKTLKYLSAIVVLFAAFNSTSCGDVEPVDPTIGTPGPNPNPPGDCTAPIAFQASNFIDFTNVNLSWAAGSDETSWQVQYGTSGFTLGTGTIETSDETNYTIEDLDPGDSYHFYVRAICVDGGYSAWVGPVSVNGGTTTGCSIPVDVAAVRSDTNSTQVTVSWTAAGSAASWEIQYGSPGFTPGTGTSVTSNSTTKILSNMPRYHAYHLYVRSICAEENSLWVGPIILEASNVLSANVNLTTFVPVDVNASVEPLEEINYITISATNEDGNTIKIQFDKSLSTGTYSESPDVIFSYTDEGIEYIANPDNPGTITIIEKNPHFMRGTFSYNTVDEDGILTHTVMNGSFAVNF